LYLEEDSQFGSFCRRIDRTPHFPDEAFDFQRAN
jgi:hypothetical protein